MEQQDRKSPKSYIEQMDKLRSRGCEISDEQECVRLLSQTNYYRLTAYCLPFKQDDDSYAPGTKFATIFMIYEFDRKMRHLLFNVLEEAEVNLRTRIAYFHAHAYGKHGYLDPLKFNERHNHEKFLISIEREKEVNKNLPFVKHHKERYSGDLPVWAIVELFTFGMLSKFYADMVTQDQKRVAKESFDTTKFNLRSWLHCCTHLRNMCAHYCRLYYHQFSIPPAVPATFNMDKSSQVCLFGAVFALKKIYPDKDKWNNEFIPQMSALIEEYRDYIELSHIGFTPNWKQELSN